MSHVSDFLTPAELQKVANLQVVARLVVEGFFSGLHKSPHKGFSVEFAQHRLHEKIDWMLMMKIGAHDTEAPAPRRDRSTPHCPIRPVSVNRPSSNAL